MQVRADQLPVHSYAVSKAPSAMLHDEAALAALAESLRADLETDLATYDIRDTTTLRSYYRALSTIAMLQHRPQGALDYEDRAAALEEKPAAKALSGMTLRPLIAAEKAGPTGAHAFSAAFAAELARLPYESVQAEIKTTRSRLETLSPATLEGMAASVIDPAARAGRISKELALQLVNLSFALGRVLPRAGAVSSEALVAQPRLDGPNLRPLGYEDSPTVGSSRENPTRRGFIGSRCR